jgi:hypothetical protein
MDDPETGLGRDAVPVSQGALIVVAGHDMESTGQASDIGDMSKGCMRRALRAAGRCSFVLAQCGRWRGALTRVAATVAGEHGRTRPDPVVRPYLRGTSVRSCLV